MSGSVSRNKTTVRRSRKNGSGAEKAASSNPPALNPRAAKGAAEVNAQEIDKEFALYEQQHALLDGFFEPSRKVKDGDLRIRRIKGVYDYQDPKTGEVHKKAVRLELVIPYLLNPQAESILLALIKFAGKDGLENGLEIEAEQPYLPMLFETIKGDASGKPIVYIRTTQYQLMQAAGMGTGKQDYRLLSQYLKYMSEVTVHYENTADKFKANVHLLDTAEDLATGNIIVRLNWRLTGAIIGKYRYAEIDLKERRALQKDASKTLHRWLSANLWEGGARFYLYETLIKHIWTQEASAGAQRVRLTRLKNEILPEIGKLDGWTVEISKEGAKITHHQKS